MLRRLLLAKDTIGSLTEAGLAQVQGGQQGVIEGSVADPSGNACDCTGTCSITTRAVSNPTHCVTTGKAQQQV